MTPRTQSTAARRTRTVPGQRTPPTRRGARVVHLSFAERVEKGKEARARAPRRTHAVFEPSPSRPDPVALLEEQAASRVPELVPVRYGRMLVSPFTFFRGAALVMAHDLAETPASGLVAQLCGDAHLSNFGGFGSAERRLVFDINDFDETLPGPWEWDVKRLAASLVVAGRGNGFDAAQTRAAAMACVSRYRTSMREFAAMRNLDVWYAHLDVETLMAQLAPRLGKKGRLRLDKAVAKAYTRDSMQALSKLAEVVDGSPRIVADPPLVVPLSDMADIQRETMERQLHSLFRQYRRTLQSDRRVLLEQFRIVDMAHKVVGVGSVGTRAWIVLLLGRDDQDPLFLQAKEAQESVLARFAGASEYANQGQRVVAGQRLMQTTSDIFLGWQRARGLDGRQRDFYLRQLRDWKASAVVETMDPVLMSNYAELCGWTLARAHARSGDRIAIAAYLGSSDVFDGAVADFAEAYADQNERDHRALVEAVDAGRVTAQTGV